MSITKSQFCSELLTEYFNPAGPILLKSQLTSDDKRPLVKAKITKGFRATDSESVEIELTNILHVPGDNLFNQECFEFNCFEEEGINTIVKEASNICYVNYKNKNVLMEAQKRARLGLQCITNAGKPRYFARGNRDINNYVYLADIGIINFTSGVFTVIQSNVPFFSKQYESKLFAKSTAKIGPGIKAARIKRFSSVASETLGYVYGQTSSEFFFPHTVLKNSREFNYNNQKISLENLSISLLLLTTFKQSINIKDQIIYRNNNYSSPEVESSIINSAETLINLILTEDLPQNGSVPAFIASYSSDQNEYNSSANNTYENLFKTCFDLDCFDGGCFEEVFNNSIINRDISNRACCWLLIFLVSYSINYNKDYTNIIKLIAEYLLRQKDDETLLFFKGWKEKEKQCVELNSENNQDIAQEDLEEICLEEVDELDNSFIYQYSLELDRDLNTSTNVAIFMALLKTFEATQDFKYLAAADELYNSMEKYLLTNKGVYKHSLNTKEPSIESATYQILIIDILQEYQNINPVINFFKSRLLAIPEPKQQLVMVGEEVVYVDSEEVTVLSTENLSADSDKILFTLTKDDVVESLDDIFVLNYLSFSTLKSAGSKVAITFTNLIQEKYKIIERLVVEDRLDTSLIFTIGCLTDNVSFMESENQAFESMVDFQNYRLQKELVFSKLVQSIPKDYGWFNPNLLAKRSNISSLLFSFAKVLGLAYTEAEFWLRVNSIDSSYGMLLNNRSKDYGVNRQNKESDSFLKFRIKNKMLSNASNKESIESNLALFNSEGIVNDNYRAIQAFESLIEEVYTTGWNKGYIQGNRFNTNYTTLTFQQPVEPDVYKEIQDIKPAGIKIEVLETLTFFLGVESNKGTAVAISDINGGCDNLDLETGKDYLLEFGKRICIEDEDTVLTPVVIDPPILPPSDNVIIKEDQNPCDCLFINGYITVNGIPTEVRSMRVVTANNTEDFVESYDVNFTNDTQEPCELYNKRVIKNNNKKCLTVNRDNFSFGTAGTIRKIEDVFTDEENIYTLGLFEDPVNRIKIVKEIEGEVNTVKVLQGADSSDNLESLQTTNYILILKEGTLYVVNKSTMIVQPLTGIFNSSIEKSKLIKLTDNSVGIYSNKTSNNNLYHYMWSENNPTTINVLGSLTFETEMYHAYYFENGYIKRLSGNTIYDGKVFSQLGIKEYNVSLNASAADQLTSNYFIDRDDSLPSSNIKLYRKRDSIVRHSLKESVVKELQYLDSYTTQFTNTGLIKEYEDFIFIQGSNRVYSIKENSFLNINSYLCNSSNTYNNNYIIQAINYSNDGLILYAVDLVNNQWDRYFINIDK